MNGITAELKEGETFSSPPYTLSIERLLAFSGGPIGDPDWPAKNLHTDMAKAKHAGLSAPIASGIQYEGYLIRLLTDAFGEAWFTGGSLQVKYPKPVLADETVRAWFRVAAKEPAKRAVLFKLDVWCENQRGEKVLVGTATCTQPLETGGDA